MGTGSFDDGDEANISSVKRRPLDLPPRKDDAQRSTVKRRGVGVGAVRGQANEKEEGSPEKPETADAPSMTVATAVNSDSEGTTIIGETEREKIQKEAAREVEEKVLSKVVRADVVEEVHVDRRKRRQRRRCALGSIGALTTVAIIVFVVLYLRERREKNRASGDSSLPTPTFPPAPQVGYGNSSLTCEGALDLTNRLGEPILGTTVQARQEFDKNRNLLSACDAVQKNGAGVWFTLKGDGNTKVASTCGGYFDTQISIFTGSCEDLQCVAGNDQMLCGNGDQSKVAWPTKEGAEYFIFVNGHRRARGVFELVVDDLPVRDRCEDAVMVDPENIFATTRGSTVIPGGPEQCGDSESESTETRGGVWYKIRIPEKHTGTPLPGVSIMVANIQAQGYTRFLPRMSLFTGDDCGNLDCLKSAEWTMTWEGIQGSVYYVFVSGMEEDGDFILFLGELTENPNGDSNIEGIRPITCGSSPMISPGEIMSGDTSLGLEVFASPCGRSTFIDGFGKWFRVTGTGSIMRASTCGTTSGFDTQITIFRGGCNSLVCLDGNDQSERCDGDQSTVTWYSNPEEEYFLFVHGYNSRKGMFNITIEDEITSDEPLLDVGSSCNNAVSLPLDQDSVLGSFKEAPPVPDLVSDLSCTPGDGIATLWYTVEGTGNPLTVSACDAMSTTSLRLVVTAGGCDRIVCAQDVVTTPCRSRESVTWPSRLGETYHVLAIQIAGENRRLVSLFNDTATTTGPMEGEEDFPRDPRPIEDDPEGEGEGIEGGADGEGKKGEEVGFVPEEDFLESLAPGMPEGAFVLFAGEVPANDACEDAIGPLLVTAFGEPTRGSLWSATADDVDACYPNSSTNSTRDVWYTVIGTGRRMIADVCTADSNVGITVSIYTGGCAAVCERTQKHATCHSGAIHAAWKSEEGVLYHVRVHGSSLPGESSNFGLLVISDNIDDFAE